MESFIHAMGQKYDGDNRIAMINVSINNIVAIFFFLIFLWIHF